MEKQPDVKPELQNSTNGNQIMQPMDLKEKKYSVKFFVIFGLAVVFGVVTGYFASGAGGVTGIGSSTQRATGGKIEAGKTYGSDDLKTFKDSAEGVLREGGIDGEGQFHLERKGGPSQNVYMTSSIVDLSEFKGKKIKVWGQTMSAQKAGWLMDVGRVQVL